MSIKLTEYDQNTLKLKIEMNPNKQKPLSDWVASHPDKALFGAEIMVKHYYIGRLSPLTILLKISSIISDYQMKKINLAIPH